MHLFEQGTWRGRRLVVLGVALLALHVVLFPSAGTAQVNEKTKVPDKLTVKEAVRLTLDNNPGLKASRVSLLAAQSGLATSRDLVETSLFAGAGVTGAESISTETSASAGGEITLSTRQGDQITASLVPASTSDFESALQLRYSRPLMKRTGYLSEANTRIVNAQWDLAREDFQTFLSRQDAVTDTVRAYYNAMRARDLIEVSKSDVGIAEETVRVARRRFEEDLVAEIEVSRAEIQLAQSRDDLVGRERAFQDALDSLLLTMGLDVGQKMELTDTIPTVDIGMLDVNALTGEALKGRRDLNVLEIGIERQKLEGRLADDDLQPSVSLTSRFQKAGLSIFGGRNSSTEDTWSGGVEYSLPLDSTARKERREIAKRNLEQLYVDYQFRKEQIKNEVLAAVRQIQAIDATLEIFEANLEVAQANLRLAQRMVEEGLVLNRDVLEAQVALTRTRTSLVSAEIDYYLAIIQLRKALGRDIAAEMLI